MFAWRFIHMYYYYYIRVDTGWLKAVVYTLAGIGGVIGDLNYYESTQKLCTTYFVYLSLSLSFELLRTILTQMLNIPSYIYMYNYYISRTLGAYRNAYARTKTKQFRDIEFANQLNPHTLNIALKRFDMITM